MEPGLRELTVQEAAAACGVSESTIRRHLPAFPGARRPPGESRGWLIPVTDLLAQGFTIDARDPSSDTPTADQAALAREVRELRAEVAALERELDELDTTNQHLLRRAEVAEALSAEREQTIAALQLALSRIEPPASSAGTAPAAQTESHAAEGPDPLEDLEMPEPMPAATDVDSDARADDPVDEPPVDSSSGPAGGALLERTLDLRNAPTNRQRRLEAARRTLLGADADDT